MTRGSSSCAGPTFVPLTLLLYSVPPTVFQKRLYSLCTSKQHLSLNRSGSTLAIRASCSTPPCSCETDFLGVMAVHNMRKKARGRIPRDQENCHRNHLSRRYDISYQDSVPSLSLRSPKVSYLTSSDPSESPSFLGCSSCLSTWFSPFRPVGDRVFANICYSVLLYLRVRSA